MKWSYATSRLTGFTFLLIIWLSNSLSAQDRAWYLMRGQGADLLKVDLSNEGFQVIEKYSFQEEVKKLEGEFIQSFFDITPCIPEPFERLDTSKLAIGGSFMEQRTCTADSFIFRGQYHKLTFSFFDDGYIGGRPNQVEQRIHLLGVGMIFSYANFLNGHSAMLISLEDTAKNALLQAAFDHLNGKSLYYSNNEFPMASAIPYSICLQALESRWLSSKYGLRLASFSSVDSNYTVKYSATIYNPTQFGYYLNAHVSVAPSRAQIKFQNPEQNHIWNLLDTHYGSHFLSLRESLYIAPGDSVIFDWDFKRYHGCGNCTDVEYEGFQVYGNFDLYSWFFTNSTYKKGQLYLPFVQREIH